MNDAPPRPTVEESAPARPTGDNIVIGKASTIGAKASQNFIRNRGFYVTLTQGDEFNKFKHKRSIKRFIWVDKKLENIHWADPYKARSSVIGASPRPASAESEEPEEKSSLPLSELEAVVVERAKCTSDCDLFLKRFAMNENNCLSLKFKTRTLDLEAISKTIRDDWATALVNVFLMSKDRNDFLLFMDDDDDLGNNTAFSSMEITPRADENSPPPLASVRGMVSMDNLMDELKDEGFAKVLATGGQFKKYKKGRSGDRYVWTDGKMRKLYWGTRSGPGKRKVKGSINCAEIMEIATTADTSPSECPAFRQRLETAAHLCITVVGAHRTVDLEAPTGETRDRFVQALKQMLDWRHQSLGGDEYREKRQIKMVLTKGNTFLKFNEKKGQERFVWVDTKLEKIYWGDKKSVINKSTGKFRPHKAKGCMLIDDIKKIVTNKAECESTSKPFALRFEANETSCMSIDAEGRFLDLEAPSAEVRDAWVKSLRTVIALGAGSAKKKPYIFDGEEGNEDLTDEDEGKEVNDVDSEEERMNLPKIEINLAKSEEKMKATKAHNKARESQLEEKKAELVSNLPKINIDSKVEDFMVDLQCDIGADRSFLLRVEDQRTRAAFIEGISDEALISRYCFAHGQSAIGKFAQKKAGEVLVLADAYENADFDLAFDNASKYKTTSFMAIHFGSGIICFANKQDMQFKKDYFQKSHIDTVQSKLGELKGLLNW
jgi:hypothetical protein